jgi:aspartyl/asparaginyl-tRNA synthetase
MNLEGGKSETHSYFYQEIIDFKGSRVQTKSKYTWILKYPFSFKPFYTPRNEVVWGYTGFTMSVRL